VDYRPPQVVGFDERTLKVTSVWTLPSGAGYHVNGMSVDAAHDELIVAVDDGSHNPLGPGPGLPVGVTIYTYSLSAALADPNAQPRYSYKVASCQRGDNPSITPNPPFRSRALPQIVVPCTIASSVTQAATGTIGQPPPKTGIVTVELDASGKPTGKESVALSPGAATSFMYDAVSDRGFLALDGPSGPVIFGYDGRTKQYIGRTATGDAGDVLVDSAGLDPRTGRVYAAGPSGIYLVDGRRTPLSVGSKFGAFGGVGQTRAIAVFPPLPGVPYTQVVAPLANPKCDPFHSDQATSDRYCTLPTLPVYADRLPITVDPPLTDLDANTFSGTFRPGDLIKTSYGANARGYGLHSDYVGNANATINNSTFQGTAEQLKAPFASGNNDQLAAEVSRLSVADGTAQGGAAAVADGSGATTSDYHHQLGEQPYPFPTAECSNPGPSGGQRETADGYASGGNPDHPDMVGTSAQAHAAVDCAPTGDPGATAEARYAGAAPAESPGFGFGESRTTARVTRTATASRAEVTATTAGFRLDLGGGNGISIGRVTHHALAVAGGRPGTAKAERTVVLADVSATIAGTEVVLCQGVCPGDSLGVLAQLNALYPALLHITEPRPDAVLFAGTPKGYIAGVAAEAAQIYGDQGFNGMSAEESTYLPALRVVVYNDGGSNNREVIDLAGVQVDAELGIDVLAQYVPSGPPPSLPDQSDAAGATVPPTLGGSTDPNLAHVTPAVGTPSSLAGRVLRRVLDGFGWLARSPAQALRFFSLLLLLALPLLLMDRRRRWVRDVMEGAA
jgi:hypothetical protein